MGNGQSVMYIKLPDISDWESNEKVSENRLQNWLLDFGGQVIFGCSFVIG
jgi:hypothetical protein